MIPATQTAPVRAAYVVDNRKDRVLLVAGTSGDRFHYIVKVEAAGFLAGRKVLEAL